MNIDKKHRIFFCTFFIYKQVSLITLLIITYNCELQKNIIILTLSLINFLYFIDLRYLYLQFNYYRDQGYWLNFRCLQILSFILCIISLLNFTNNKTCHYGDFKYIDIIFYFILVSFIIFSQIFISKYKNTSVSVQYELNIFEDKLKGKIIYDKISECSICLSSDLEEAKTEKIVELNCSHSYHYKCLNDCFLNNITKCPLCRVQYI